MRYTVSFSMCTVIIACLVIPNCYALDWNDNGYKWNTANESERIPICKSLAGSIGMDYNFWLKQITSFYNTTDTTMLNLQIKQAAQFLTSITKAREKYQQRNMGD